MLLRTVELRNAVHFLLAQLEIKNLRVLANVRGVGRPRNHHDAALQIPAENHLRRGLPVRTPDRVEDRVRKKRLRVAAAAQRIPGLNRDP